MSNRQFSDDFYQKKKDRNQFQKEQHHSITLSPETKRKKTEQPVSGLRKNLKFSVRRQTNWHHEKLHVDLNVFWATLNFSCFCACFCQPHAFVWCWTVHFTNTQNSTATKNEQAPNESPHSCRTRVFHSPVAAFYSNFKRQNFANSEQSEDKFFSWITLSFHQRFQQTDTKTRQPVLLYHHSERILFHNNPTQLISKIMCGKLVLSILLAN